MFFLIILSIIFFLAFQFYKYCFPSPNINPNGKYVLITGCGSGFGYDLAIELDKQGFHVFAGVHNAQSIVNLQSNLSSRSQIFVLDVTKQEDIDAAYDRIKEKTNSLHALVNNAGFARIAYIDWMPMDLLRQTMDVNFFAHVAMTKKFLPLLISKRYSRVVNVSSITGFIGFAGASSYSTSKYALESFSDCLRREMASWGLHVSIIEPGAMGTTFFKQQQDHFRNLWNELPLNYQQRWGKDFIDKMVQQIVDSSITNYSEDPIKAVQAIQHAVMNSQPQIRYRPGWQAKFLFILTTLFPDWLIDKLLLSGASNAIPASVKEQF